MLLILDLTCLKAARCVNIIVKDFKLRYSRALLQSSIHLDFIEIRVNLLE